MPWCCRVFDGTGMGEAPARGNRPSVLARDCEAVAASGACCGAGVREAVLAWKRRPSMPLEELDRNGGRPACALLELPTEESELSALMLGAAAVRFMELKLLA